MIESDLLERIEALEARLAALEGTGGPDTLYTLDEAAARLRCSRINVWRLVDAGDLAAARVGAGRAGIRIRGAAIEAFLESRTAGGPKPEFEYVHLKEFMK